MEPDLTDKYNTPLSEEEQSDYDTKFSPKDSFDYDMQGWYKANPGADPKGEGVHYPDTFKKPNHPTFSDQSQYHGVDGYYGGTWQQNGNAFQFYASGTNMQMYNPADLSDYFSKVEKGNSVIFPP